jgi:hypothetical protein
MHAGENIVLFTQTNPQPTQQRARVHVTIIHDGSRSESTVRLLTASLLGDTQAVQNLLINTDIDAAGIKAALSLAIQMEHINIIEILLTDHRLQIIDLYDIFDIANEKGNSEIIRMVLSRLPGPLDMPIEMIQKVIAATKRFVPCCTIL